MIRLGCPMGIQSEARLVVISRQELTVSIEHVISFLGFDDNEDGGVSLPNQVAKMDTNL